MHDQVQREPLPVDLGRGRVDQERHVVVDDLDHRVARGPAVLGQRRAEHAYLRPPGARVAQTPSATGRRRKGRRAAAVEVFGIHAAVVASHEIFDRRAFRRGDPGAHEREDLLEPLAAAGLHVCVHGCLPTRSDRIRYQMPMWMPCARWRVGARLDLGVVDGRPALARREPVERRARSRATCGFEPGVGPEVASSSGSRREVEKLRAKSFPVHVFPLRGARTMRAAVAGPAPQHAARAAEAVVELARTRRRAIRSTRSPRSSGSSERPSTRCGRARDRRARRGTSARRRSPRRSASRDVPRVRVGARVGIVDDERHARRPRRRSSSFSPSPRSPRNSPWSDVNTISVSSRRPIACERAQQAAEVRVDLRDQAHVGRPHVARHVVAAEAHAFVVLR